MPARILRRLLLKIRYFAAAKRPRARSAAAARARLFRLHAQTVAHMSARYLHAASLLIHVAKTYCLSFVTMQPCYGLPVTPAGEVPRAGMIRIDMMAIAGSATARLIRLRAHTVSDARRAARVSSRQSQ